MNVKKELLIVEAERIFKNIPKAHIELIVDDYSNRTEYYDDLANGNIEILEPKIRDTKANIKNQSLISIDNE